MKAITVRLPDDLRELLLYAAESNRQTQSDYLRGVIEAHLDQVHVEEFHRENDNITLTLPQRQTLALGHMNLLATMGDLPEERYDKDHSLQAIGALEQGYAGEYPRLFAPDHTGLTYNECKLVWDILDMFRIINSSIDNLGKDAWDQIRVSNAQNLGRFQGFDYQIEVEGKMASYVEYLVKTGRWEEQTKAVEAELNSHTQMLPTYLAMLAAFKPLWRKLIHGSPRFHFSADDLTQIFLAAPGARRTVK